MSLPAAVIDGASLRRLTRITEEPRSCSRVGQLVRALPATNLRRGPRPFAREQPTTIAQAHVLHRRRRHSPWLIRIALRRQTVNDLLDELTIGHLRLLVSAAEEGSFTRAAAKAGLSPAAVSKIVMRLERRLGAQLFVRTTRRMRLTDTGERYVARCREAIALLQDAGRTASGAQAVPSGRLRLSVPTPYPLRLLPRLPQFRALYPAVSLEVQVSDRPVSLAGERFDVAIRGYEMADSGLIARKLEDAELVVVAAPDYLRRAPPLRTPADLADHECIRFRLPESGRAAPWSFRIDGERAMVEIAGGVGCEDEYMAGVALARAGAGLYQMYRFAVAGDLARGDLVEVLPEFGGTTRPFYLVHAASVGQSAGLRAFIDFVVDKATAHRPAGRPPSATALAIKRRARPPAGAAR